MSLILKNNLRVTSFVLYYSMSHLDKAREALDSVFFKQRNGLIFLLNAGLHHKGNK